MEVNVYNIKGEDTGRKITLNESIFGICLLYTSDAADEL